VGASGHSRDGVGTGLQSSFRGC